MKTRINEHDDAIVVQFHCGEIVKSGCISDAANHLADGCRMAVEQDKSLHFDLRSVATLSAAAIGRFVSAGRLAHEKSISVRFMISPDLEGIFRVLRLDNLFDIQIETGGAAVASAPNA